MRRGSFPGQEEALESRLAELARERSQASRRRFLAFVATGGIGVAFGAALQLTLSPDTRMPPNSGLGHPIPKAGPELDWARALADGPIEGLLGSQVNFAVSLLQCNTLLDDRLLAGVARLVQAAAESDARIKPGLPAVLRSLCDKHALPGLRAQLRQSPRGGK